MDDIERKLNSNNPIVVAQIISTLIKSIKEKHETGISEPPQLDFLKKKCLDEDPLVNELACLGIIKLVEDGVLQIETTLTDFVTIPQTQCFSGLVKLLENLLYMELKQKVDSDSLINYRCKYKLNFPKHPFVTLLDEYTECARFLWNEIKYFFSCRDIRYTRHGWELFRSVYLYVVCNPHGAEESLLKRNLWSLLVHCDEPQNRNLTIDLISWMNLMCKKNLLQNSECLNEILTINENKNIYDQEIFILWQTTILHHLILHKLDPIFTIHCLLNHCKSRQSLTTVNCLLLILAKTIKICSPVYLNDLLKLCDVLVKNEQTHTFALHSIKASLLQWLANSCLLISEANKLINDIFNYIENFTKPMKSNDYLIKFVNKFKYLVITNDYAFTSINLCILSQHWKSISDVLEWLEKLKLTPQFFIYNIIHFVFGLFLQDHNDEVAFKSFLIIEKCMQSYNVITSEVLTLILYKLSNTMDSQMHYTLLKALPKMVVSSNNLTKVLVTIDALSAGSEAIQNFSTLMMFEAWKINHKCYSYLEKHLLKVHYKSHSKLQLYTTKAYILKELCDRRPELYGKDMVTHLSKILNECKTIDDSVPCALALEGVTLLCKSGITDVSTTWESLEPIFRDDNRVLIVKGLCNLFAQLPNMPYVENYTDAQINKVVETLWNYVSSFHNLEVLGAALNGLTSYTLEQISSQIPAIYLSEDTLKLRESNTENILFKIPGNTWITLIEKLDAHVVGDFLIKMISIEITGYPKYVYNVKSSKEPLRLDYLPTHSILRAVGEHLRKNIQKWKHCNPQLYLECLRIFSKKYSKPLPPLDWSFLQELFQVPEAKYYCIDIASHQVILSGAARRLMENCILEVTKNQEDETTVSIFNNLKYLANSIQPVILKPFLEKSLTNAINQFSNKRNSLLGNIVKALKEMLEDENVDYTNKVTVASVVSNNIFESDVSSEVFNILAECAVVNPTIFFKKQPYFKSIKVTDEHFVKVIKMKCSVASHSSSQVMDWLNEVIESDNFYRKKSFILENLLPVIRNHVENAECALWLSDIIGQIQGNIALGNPEEQIIYLIDILILSVIVFSGYSMFAKSIDSLQYDELIKLFPQAFIALLDFQHWSVCTPQALEWLYHMNINKKIPREYRNMFGRTLQCLRHNDRFKKDTNWMNYLSCTIE